jgi:hypothetical protein
MREPRGAGHYIERYNRTVRGEWLSPIKMGGLPIDPRRGSGRTMLDTERAGWFARSILEVKTRVERDIR